MPVYTTNFANLLQPNLRHIFGEYDPFATEYSTVFNQEDAKYAVTRDQGVTGLGTVPVKQEGKSVTFDTIFQTYQKSYTQITYGLGVIITREMYEDDLYREMNNLVKALRRSVDETVEILDANILNNAFSTELAADGVAICSASHLTMTGGNYRNILSTPADLDITSYEQMLIDMATIPIDGRGKKVNVKPQKLVIHPSNDFQAKQILKSAQLPGTANNDWNPAQSSMPGGVVTMHWLTDPDAWFIKTNVPDGLNHFWKRHPEFTKDNDADTQNAKFIATFRMISGCTDPLSIFGTAGG